jgi:predicted negative regulator of RcsB-dependent stress response
MNANTILLPSPFDAALRACDAHHHFYHYKSSWMHLCYGHALRAKGDENSAAVQYKSAIFQDHLNEEAKGKGTYNTHITTGAIDALSVFETSLGWEEDISVALCKTGEFEAALKVCAARHDRYHHYASDLHKKRGDYYAGAGALDLAIADYSKALDLYGKNRTALRARAAAYRLKDSARLAEADEMQLISL